MMDFIKESILQIFLAANIVLIILSLVTFFNWRSSRKDKPEEALRLKKRGIKLAISEAAVLAFSIFGLGKMYMEFYGEEISEALGELTLVILVEVFFGIPLIAVVAFFAWCLKT